MESQAMTRAEGISPLHTAFVPPLRMSCHAIHSSSLDGRNPWIMRVAGDVNCTTSVELHEEIDHLLMTDHPDRLILDLEGVTHMDSSGLGALLAGLRDANNLHVRFTLSGLSSSLRHTLERTRLYSLFDIRPTVHEALQA
jgi:anti-sigma B factor antagonist